MIVLIGIFWSLNYLLDYSNYVLCKWEIIVFLNYIILVIFEDVILECICCWCDYVEVWEMLKNGFVVLIIKFCDDIKLVLF